ncbi:hypothetical protein MSG28_015244 [Choristoneura fumiferana]|uniref:Uncharacterized protein n=1 Tax=Choristoneura fumiferana TaxID=7141 RepID=A0ACC0KYZ2_CHOFU|nr:hypothetical protein MSG28_015244 [Choristoneura fumiferana]
MKFQMLLVLCVLVSVQTQDAIQPPENNPARFGSNFGLYRDDNGVECIVDQCLVRVRGGPLTRGHVANRGREGRKVPSRLPFLVRLPPSTTPCQQRICFGRMQTRLPFLALPQELQTTTQPPALPKLALVVYESEPSRLPGLVRCPAVKQTTHMIDDSDTNLDYDTQIESGTDLDDAQYLENEDLEKSDSNAYSAIDAEDVAPMTLKPFEKKTDVKLQTRRPKTKKEAKKKSLSSPLDVAFAIGKQDDKDTRFKRYKDDLEAFGHYVATSLRKLSDNNIINAQDEIQAILSRYKAGRGRRAKDLPVIGRISNSSDFYNSDISDFSDMGNISGDEFHSNTNISGIARTNDIANIGSVANTSDAGNMSYTGDSDVDFLLKIANDKKSDNTGDSDDDFLDNNAVIDNTMISSKITKTSGNKVANRDGQHEVTLPFESDFDDNHENFSPLHEEIHSSTYKYKKWEDFFGNHTTIPTTAEITRPSSCPYYKTSSTAAPTKMGMPHHAYKQYDATEAPCLDYYNPIYDLVMTMCGHDFTDDTDLTCRERFLNVGPNAPRSYDPSFGYY